MPTAEYYSLGEPEGQERTATLEFPEGYNAPPIIQIPRQMPGGTTKQQYFRRKDLK